MQSKSTKRATKVAKEQPVISEDTIRRKAQEIYEHTHNPNAEENWFQARKELGLQ